MINRKDAAVHMRYMIATSLLMLGPGLGRALIIFGGIPFPVAVTIVIYISEIIAALFLINDIRKGNNFKPFLTITIILILNQLCWTFQSASWWQSIASWFVSHTF
jgi:Trk-type K+ transport system membrane component